MQYTIVTFYVLLCVPYIIASTDNFIINQSSSNESVVIAEIITKFFIKYFSDEQIFISIIIPAPEKQEHYFHEDFFIELFDHPTLAKFAHNTLNKLSDSIGDLRHAFNLILVDEYESLANILNESTVEEFHLSQRFLIVFVGKVVESLDEIFEILWKNGLVDSHVLTKDKDQFWSLNTFMPYQSSCFTVTHVKLAYFMPFNFTESLNVSFDELYPNKLQNFNKCPVYIAVSQASPFTIRNDILGNRQFDGIEILVVKQFSRSLNFTIVYKTSPDDRGTLFANGTASGNLEMVIKGEANLTIGGTMLTAERINYMLASIPIIQSSIVLVYKEGSIHLSQYIIRLQKPFKLHVWLIIIGILLSATFIILLMKKLTQRWRHFYIGGRMNRTPILNMWLIVLGRAIGNRRITSGRNFSNFAQTLTILWILLWLLIRSWYEAALYNEMQNIQTESPFDTVAKVQASKCKIVLQPSDYRFVANIFKTERFLKASGGLQTVLHYYHDHDINGVAITNDVSAKYFNLVNSLHKRLGISKDRLFMFSSVFYFHKPSALRDSFNVELIKYREAGLLIFWIRKYVNNKKLKFNQKTPTKLRIGSIVDVFKICGILYSISLVVFILEIASEKFNRIRSILDYLTY